MYVQGYRRIFALDAVSGDVLWDHSLDEAVAPVGRPLLLGDRVAFVYRDRVLLVEPVSGTVVAEMALDGLAEHAVGAPLTLALRRRSDEPGRSEGEVVRIDERTGEVVARRELLVLGLAAEEGRLLAVRSVEPSETGADGAPTTASERLLELSVDDLSTVRSWRGADALVLRSSRGGGSLVPFETTEEGVRYRTVRDLDDDAGARSSMAPRSRREFYDLDAELQAEFPDGSEGASALRRLDLETGDVLWTTLLPDAVGGWLWDGDRLLVHTRPREGGRGLLVTLDAETGTVLEAAYGLASVRSLERSVELVIAVTEDEVVAFEAEELGPPEAATSPVADEVDRLLARLEGRRAPFVDQDLAQELGTLGEDVLPILLERLPSLAPQAALTVTSALSAARYRPAAPRLEELLASFPDPPESAPPEWTHAHPKVLILTALGRLGGPAQVPAIGAVLLDATEALPVHERALTALAELGGPEAPAWVDRFYAPHDPASHRTSGESLAGAPGRAESPDVASLTDEDLSRLAIVRHFATFRRVENEAPFCVVGDRALPWSAGRSARGLVVVTSLAEADGVACGFGIRPEPATEDQVREYLEHHPALDPEERLWVLSAGRGSAGEAHWVVLRPVAGRWLVRSMILWWIA